jgi:hypothetical protein
MKIHLFDTPAIVSHGTDDDAFEAFIPIWVETRDYWNSVQDVSIVYFHRITDSRMGGTSSRSLEAFKKFCPESLRDRVVFATTCWDVLGNTGYGQAVERERELMKTDKLWGSMLRSKSKVIRLEGSCESARHALEQIKVWHISDPISYGLQDVQIQFQPYYSSLNDGSKVTPTQEETKGGLDMKAIPSNEGVPLKDYGDQKWEVNKPSSG